MRLFFFLLVETLCGFGCYCFLLCFCRNVNIYIYIYIFIYIFFGCGTVHTYIYLVIFVALGLRPQVLDIHVNTGGMAALCHTKEHQNNVTP
jgi:hypothetical protein